MALADLLRSKNGIEWRSAVLSGDRAEYFRGKDFASYFRERPEKLAGLVTGGERPPARTPRLSVCLSVHLSVCLSHPAGPHTRLSVTPECRLPSAASRGTHPTGAGQWSTGERGWPVQGVMPPRCRELAGVWGNGAPV
jgi:hypothetical protein